MKRYHLLGILLFIHGSFINKLISKNITTADNKIIITQRFETKNSFVTFMQINGKKYLVKQKKVIEKQISTVRDALAAFLAKELKIAHSVTIISYKKKFPGKINHAWPATLHTVAPGDIIRKQKDTVYSQLQLKQLWALAKNFEEKGLTKKIITHMSWHKQLPVIIALDLITGNSDRHGGNLCYDPQTDRFCAIDMDDTFNKDLCLIACKKLSSMKNSVDVDFTQQEIEGLILLRKTLHILLQRHKVSDVIKKLYEFAQKAGFFAGSAMYTPSISRKLLLYESMIVQTWKSAYKLVTILDDIIKKYKKDTVGTFVDMHQSEGYE